MPTSKAGTRPGSPTTAMTAGASQSFASTPDDAKTGAAHGGDGSSETLLCKHCKEQIPKDLHASHSKPCLRAKQELKKKRQEEKERKEREAAGGGEDKSTNDMDGDTKIGGRDTGTNAKKADKVKDKEKAKPPPVDASTRESAEKDHEDTSSNSTKIKLKKSDTTASVESPVAPKKPNKKRKATDTDTTSVNGDTTPFAKPPPKKQKKNKDATDTTSTLTTTAPAASSSMNAPSSSSGTKDPKDTKETPASSVPKEKDTKKPTTTGTTGGTGGKPKGPVDVEKQCGVLLPNGAMCARSLTCKSHAMGAKRAVPGRSLPYDVLLAQYQKKNQAKMHKAALASGAPLAEDAEGGVGGPVDSDEERELVVQGVLRARPRPLAECYVGSVRSRTMGVRVREMLAQAMAGNRGAGLFAVAPRNNGAATGGTMGGVKPAGASGGVSAAMGESTGGESQQVRSEGEGMPDGVGSSPVATRTPAPTANAAVEAQA